MVVASNISIKSNIYINSTKTLFDKEFMKRVRGQELLAKLNKSRGTLESWSFCNEQKDVISYGPPMCGHDKPNISWGINFGDGEFVCKCENKKCSHYYEKCSRFTNFRKISRVQLTAQVLTDNTMPDFSLLRFLDENDKKVYLEIIEKQREKSYEAETELKTVFKPSPNEELKTSDEQKDKSNKEIPAIKHGISFESIPKTASNDNGKQKSEERASQIKAVSPLETTPKTSKDDIEKKKTSVAYVPINEPDEIISLDIHDRVIVNAGPGTGKTYTVIQRLLYILREEIAPPDKILVLCYSRAAVKVIRERIEDEIRLGTVPDNARLLFYNIRTFDSFVTYMLSDDENPGTLNRLDYNARIKKFIDEYAKDPKALSDLEYFIVDELQDLVGIRAEMVKAILEKIQCGFMLLGDKCQSIYDYQITDDNEINSYRFYKWLEPKFISAKKYELTRNVRQVESLATLSSDLRNAILTDIEEKELISLETCVKHLLDGSFITDLKNIDEEDIVADSVLCRNNAEAAAICSELYSQGIISSLNNGARHISVCPWIAYILSNYTETRIAHSAFIERVFKCGLNDGDVKWTLLKIVEGIENESVLDIRQFVKNMISGKNIPDELISDNHDAIRISTVHRAKGMEFNHVQLLKENFSNASLAKSKNVLDEIKIAYVALTRAKENISFCKFLSLYVLKLDSGRLICTGWSKKNKFCSHIVIKPDDIHQYSFIGGDAIERQTYISTIHVGDSVEIFREQGGYHVLHNGVVIGTLEGSFSSEMRDAMNKTNHSNNLPSRLSNVYVSKLVTIANTKYTEIIPSPYNKSGLWLGVELAGLARNDWT